MKEVEKRRRRKGDGKSLCGRKGKRENEMWKKRRKENRRRRKGDGKSLCGRKGKRENEMWKKRRKERKRRKKKENGENGIRGHHPLRAHSLARS